MQVSNNSMADWQSQFENFWKYATASFSVYSSMLSVFFRKTFAHLVWSISWFLGTSELHHDGRKVVNSLYGSEFSKITQRNNNFAKKCIEQNRFAMPDTEDDDSSRRRSKLLSNVCAVIKTNISICQHDCY